MKDARMSHPRVAMARSDGDPARPYPEFPYDPGEAYPELAGRGVGTVAPPNPVYAAVRAALARLGFDRDRAGSPEWDPLGDLIEPGQRVLVKPNWVRHDAADGGPGPCLRTHTSVLRAVLDYVLLALKGDGRVIVGDAPLQSADGGRLFAQTRIHELLDRLDAGGIEITVRDFRENVCDLDARGRIVGHRKLDGDPDGYATVDLGAESLFGPVDEAFERFRVTNYDPAVMRAHHARGRHEYLIAGSVLASDTVVSVPKLKTHRKAGLTCALKNVVGINGSKDYLPHHRKGPVDEGGDEYERRCVWKRLASHCTDLVESDPSPGLRATARLVLRVARRVARSAAPDPYTEGSWFGNDTVWRTVLDLNRVLVFARPDGTLAPEPQRRVLHLVDAIVAGEGEGPLVPDPAPLGLVLAGTEAAAVDAFAARLAGLDPEKIPLVRNGLAQRDGLAEKMRFVRDDADASLALHEVRPVRCLRPPAGWAGHVELETCPLRETDIPVAGSVPEE